MITFGAVVVNEQVKFVLAENNLKSGAGQAPGNIGVDDVARVFRLGENAEQARAFRGDGVAVFEKRNIAGGQGGNMETRQRPLGKDDFFRRRFRRGQRR